MATRGTARARRSPKPKRPARSGAKRARRRPAAARGKTARARRAPAARSRAAKPRRRAPAARTRTPAVPNGIGMIGHHMDYTCHDMEAVRRFYTETLGFTRFDHDPAMDYLYVQTGPGSSLGFMPPMPGPPEQWRPPHEPALYFLVADVDQAYRQLSAKGVTFDQAPQDMPWGHRLALLRDPEGRQVCLAQPLKR